MLFYKDENGVGIFGGEKDAVEFIDEMTFVAKKTFLIKSSDFWCVDEGTGNQTNIVFEGKKYKLIEKDEKDKVLELIEPSLDENINYDLLRLMINLKEIKLIRALINLDFNNLQSVIDYDAIYNQSKNKRFIPELSIYNLDVEQDTHQIGKEILKLRVKIYESANDEEKNHIIYCIKNPIIWLPYDIKTKRILCGALQYRKGLHTRDFDLMIYNLNLLKKFPLNEDKIKFANLMRDHGLL